MKLTRVEAASMQEALWKIRATLGDEAMIVGTRTFRRGGWLGVGGKEVVEVYVADAGRAPARGSAPAVAEVKVPHPILSRMAPEAKEPPADVADLTRALGTLQQEIQELASRQRQEPFDHPFLKDAYEILVSHDVDRKFAERLVSELKSARLPMGMMNAERIRALLKAQLRKYFLPNVPTGIGEENKVMVLIGPTGVGKTTTVAKLAARAKITGGKKVGLITLDTFRIAAVDQLQKYARIIGTALDVVSDPIEFKSSIKKFNSEGMDLILVDTAGRGQRDELKMQELKEFLSAVPGAEVHLVLSTTTHPRTFQNVVKRFAELGYHRIILTKIDESESFGALAAVLSEVEKPVSYLTDGQNVPDDLMISDPDRLAELVFRPGQN
ncbi:MAG: flagellar biosynthesis protein FlhF [Planctomycetes bacterium]|nr:flagellar biosynthesis protein FlhF [Planctomycetota bacterium]